MTIYQRLQELAKSKNISIRQIKIDLNFSNGSLRKWKTTAPADKLLMVASYLATSCEYLLTGHDTETRLAKATASSMIADMVGQRLAIEISKLDNSHRQRVFAYTQAQLEDQTQYETLAAHAADPNHHVDESEAKYISDTLDDIIDQHEKKNK